MLAAAAARRSLSSAVVWKHREPRWCRWHVGWNAIDLSALRESQQVGGELRQKVGGPPGFGDKDAFLAAVVRSIQREHLQVAADNREKIFEVVRDTGRELTNGLHLQTLETFGIIID